MFTTQLNLNADIAKVPLINFLLSKEAQALMDQEKPMIAVATLINNLIFEAEKSSARGLLKEFDANPGEGGCQLRALKFRALFLSPSVQEEFQELKKTALKLKELLQTRNPKKESAADFFSHHFAPVTVSKEMLYLLECRLLQQLKITHVQDENGIIFTKTQLSRLSMLSKGIDILDSRIKNQLVDELKAKVSEESVSFIQQQADKIDSLPPDEKKLIQEMLAPERIVKSKCGSSAERSFSSAFFNMKTVLQQLKEQQALIGFKSIVKKGETPFLFLMKSPEPGAEFQIIPDKGIDPKELIVVFEGAVPGLSREAFTEKMESVGFSRLVLVCSAQEPPFTPDSDLSSIQSQSALDEISVYKKLAEQIGCVKDQKPFLILDHVFANTLEKERLRK